MSDRLIPDSECKQGKCAATTTGCIGKCALESHSITMYAVTEEPIQRIAQLEQQLAAEQEARSRLEYLFDTISDVLYGGESAWRNIDFSREQDSRDLKFLIEMQERLTSYAGGDGTQYDYLREMIADWISELSDAGTNHTSLNIEKDAARFAYFREHYSDWVDEVFCQEWNYKMSAFDAAIDAAMLNETKETK